MNDITIIEYITIANMSEKHTSCCYVIKYLQMILCITYNIQEDSIAYKYTNIYIITLFMQ